MDIPNKTVYSYRTPPHMYIGKIVKMNLGLHKIEVSSGSTEKNILT